MSACIKSRYVNPYGVGRVPTPVLGMTMLDAMHEGLVPYGCTSAGGYTGVCEAAFAEQNYDGPIIECPGSTNVVPQPAPVSIPSPIYQVSTAVIPNSAAPLLSPAPTVAADTSTSSVASSVPSGSSTISVAGIEAWFSQSTLIAGIPNIYIAGAAVIVALLLLKKGKH